jgi:hypothetical protein
MVAAVSLTWGALSYTLNTLRSRSLERTRFIFEQQKYFDTDLSMRTGNKILYGLMPDFKIEQFLRVMKEKTGDSKEVSNSMAFESYLNFIWRIAYAHIALKTITVYDLNAFGEFFYRISLNKGLCKYCAEEDFDKIIEAIEKLRPMWKREQERVPKLLALIDEY